MSTMTAPPQLLTPPETAPFQVSESDSDSRPTNRGYKRRFRSGGRIKLKPTSIDLEYGTSFTTSSVRDRQLMMFENAAQKIKPIPQTWNSQTAVEITDNIGALLVSAQVTPDEKRNADLMHRRVRRKATRAGQKRNIDGIRKGGGDTESDETSSGRRESVSYAPAGGWKRKRGNILTPPPSTKPSPLGAGESSGAGNLSLIDSRPSHRRRPRSTVQQLQPIIDVAQVQPQPIRLKYDPPARGDRSDAWFIEAFRLLYREAETFVTRYYCVHDLKAGTFYEPWNVEHTPEFLWWVEQTAEPDPVTGWDSLLRDSKERKWLIMGVLMRVFKNKIFDEELFGVDEQEAELMHAIEKTFFLSEGFHRTELRAHATRSIIGNSSVTGDFYPQVAKLTAQISLMLQPLTSYLYSIPPPFNKRLPQVTDLYQSLHNLVSRAAQLSLTIRLSPTIFHFVDVEPGSIYEADDVYSLELESFTVSKERIISPYDVERVEWVQAKAEAKSKFEALIAVGPASTAKAILAQKRIYLAFLKNSETGIRADQEVAKKELDEALAVANEEPAYTADDIQAQRDVLIAYMAASQPKRSMEEIECVRRKLHEMIRKSSEGLNQAVLEAQEKVKKLAKKVATTYPVELSESRRKLDEIEARGAVVTQKEIDEAQNEVARIDSAVPKPPGQYYRALTKIAVWPVITRYKPGGVDDDDAWEEDGPLRQSEKDGMRIMQMSKGATVNYYGRNDAEKPRVVSLRRWVREKRTRLGKKSERIGNKVFAAMLLGVGALGFWANGISRGGG